MQTIILMNKGKRPWTLKNAEGETKVIDSMGTIELDETAALRLLLDYPRDFIKASEAGTSSKDIARMEQSLRDRSANLDARSAALDVREKALDEREKALEAREKSLSANLPDENEKVPGKTETPAKKAGRPPKADKAEAEK
jgi:hypothetical protein